RHDHPVVKLGARARHVGDACGTAGCHRAFFAASVTSAMLAGLPDVTAHFSRLRVTEIALDAPALGQFDPGHMLPTAELLADAKVGSIAWNGTSASWLGIARDEILCAA